MVSMRRGLVFASGPPNCLNFMSLVPTLPSPIPLNPIHERPYVSQQSNTSENLPPGLSSSCLHILCLLLSACTRSPSAFLSTQPHKSGVLRRIMKEVYSLREDPPEGVKLII